MYVITEAGGGKITFRQQPRTQGQDAALLPDIIPYHTIVNPYATGPIWINAARHAGTKIKSLTQSSGIASSIGAFFPSPSTPLHPLAMSRRDIAVVRLAQTCSPLSRRELWVISHEKHSSEMHDDESRNVTNGGDAYS